MSASAACSPASAKPQPNSERARAVFAALLVQEGWERNDVPTISHGITKTIDATSRVTFVLFSTVAHASIFNSGSFVDIAKLDVYPGDELYEQAAAIHRRLRCDEFSAIERLVASGASGPAAPAAPLTYPLAVNNLAGARIMPDSAAPEAPAEPKAD